MSGSAIEFDRVTRRYGAVLALNDVTVSVEAGITGLIGPNGAGKTTFLNLAVGLHVPSSGKVALFGRGPFSNREVRRRMGYCPDGERAWDWMSGREFVVTLAGYGGMPAAEAGPKADAILAELELTAAAHKPIRTYSRGMRQKAKIAQAVLHDPELLILDEPLNGVDPVSRHEILKILKKRAAAGTAILVSSHVLHELDDVVDQVILLQRGRLLATGSVESIRELLDDHPHTIRLVCDRPRALATRLVAIAGVVEVDLLDRAHAFSSGEAGPSTSDSVGTPAELEAGLVGLDVRTRNPGQLYSALPKLIMETGVVVEQMFSPDSNLEAVFKYLVKGGGAG